MRDRTERARSIPADDPAVPQRVPALTNGVAAVLEAAATFTVLYVFLIGWQRDFRVPLSFSRDGLEYLMQVKGTIENGWWWVHPRLSAPGVFEQILYPSNTNVDQAIVWFVHWFTSDPALCINVSWMLMVVLSSVIASRCLSVIGVDRSIAAAIGLLFALSPYALYRQIHFSLAIYLVPVPCTTALLIAAGRLQQQRRSTVAALGVGCALVGFNYTYYAFFASFLVLAASLIAYAREWQSRAFGRGLMFVAVISAATAVNLAPTFDAWRVHGRPAMIPAKHAVEAEQYGLKIRTLVSPVFDHWFPPFRRWNMLEAQEPYPPEAETRESRLGIAATVGFLALLCGLFTTRVSTAVSDAELFVGASRLTLAALLLGTVGGFGSVFSLLVSPEIRAYSRLTPFMAFFSLVALALLVQRLCATVSSQTPRRWLPVMLAAGLIAALADQSRAADPLNRSRADLRQEWTALGHFVQTLEGRLPAGAMVFQLPVVSFLNEMGRERMLQFDQIKPYIVSTRLHWSYPALSDPIVRWQERTGRLRANVLATALEREGFSAILIDRQGYFDRAAGLMNDLGAPSDAVLAQSDRYIALDVRRLPHVEVAPDRLPRVGAVAIAATNGAQACRASTAQYLEWIGESFAPFPNRPVAVPRGGEFAVGGWAVDQPNGGLAADVDVTVDNRPAAAFYGIDRYDVALALGSVDYRAAGFTARLSAAEIGEGPHTLSIRILSADRRCYYEGAKIPIVAR